MIVDYNMDVCESMHLYPYILGGNMIKYKSILESLKDLDQPKVDELYNNMVASGIYKRAKTVDDGIMYIFPDGRMLSAKMYKSDDEMLRDVYHQHIYQDIKDARIRDSDKHPSLNNSLGTYYNLVIVAPMDAMNSLDSGGFILLNCNVDLTPEQKVIVDKLVAYGYKIAESPEEWAEDAFYDNDFW